MASGWNSGSDREAMLRRVAIVLSSLPAPVASKLLGAIDDEKKQLVRRTISTLAEVDPLERQRAIKAFKVMVERQPEAFDATTYEPRDARHRASVTAAADSSSLGQVASPASSNPSQKPLSSSPLAFLDEVDDQTLAKLLQAEHPQTSALVLASISPDQAARVLPRLGAKLQRDTMSRIGRLGEIPETAIVEVADHFRNRLQEQTATEHHRLGQKALDAILAAMPTQATMSTLPDTGLNHASADYAERVPVGGDSATVDRSGSAPSGKVFPINTRQSDSPAVDLAHRLRALEASSRDLAGTTEPSGRPSMEPERCIETPRPPLGPQSLGPQSQGPQSQGRGHQRRGPFEAKETISDDGVVAASDRHLQHPVLESTDAIHQHLIGLKPTDLCRALARVDTREAMLALCGLPVQVADAALAVLPRAQAKAVRIKMNTLGSLHLREIDLAKEKVAKASLGELPSPSLQSLMAA